MSRCATLQVRAHGAREVGTPDAERRKQTEQIPDRAVHAYRQAQPAAESSILGGGSRGRKIQTNEARSDTEKDGDGAVRAKKRRSMRALRVQRFVVLPT